MKYIIATFIFICVLSSSLQAAVSVISDLDDTIKITNADNPVEASYNGIFTLNVYSGMDELLRVMKKGSEQLLIVSATPPQLKARVSKLLNKYDIDTDGLYFKGLTKDEDVFTYKTRVIREILSTTSDSYIFLGDDVDKDPMVYATIAKEFPGRVLGVYIHVVKNRPVPEGVTRYWTAFDVALRELLAGRLVADDVQTVLVGIQDEKRISHVVPKFADCPKSVEPWTWTVETQFSLEALQLSTELVSYCQKQATEKAVAENSGN